MNRLLRAAAFWAAILTLSALLFLLLLDAVVLPRIVAVPMVTVPDVRGRTAAEASKRVAGKGLRLAVRDSVFSETAAEGQVVDQLPRPGDRIKRARRVFVDVSRGRHLYVVPDVTGGSQREASLQIQSRQLKVGRMNYASSTSVPEGVVISQRPAAGTRVASGARVNLEVSSGSPLAPKVVPKLVGLPIDVVEDSLHKYEMILGQVQERVADLLPPGQVLEQSPAGAARAPRGTGVDLVERVRRADVDTSSGRPP
jgi:serine/threonine-protein kinase